MSHDRERWTRAEAWRSAVLPDLQAAVTSLERVAAAAPASLERVQTEHALRLARGAVRACESNRRAARRHLEAAE